VRGDTSTLFTITPAPPRPALPSVQSADGQRLADGQTRTGPNRKVLAIVGGIVAAAVACVVTLLTLFSSSSSEPPTTTATTGAVTTKSGPPPVTESTESSAVPPPTTSTDPGSTSGDPDPFVRTLAAAGVDTSLPGGNAELTEYLANSEYTPYPAVAQALLDAIGTQQLRQPVAIDAIIWEYEQLASAPPPNRAELVDVGVLKKAVVEEFNSRYGGRVGDFDSLLIRR
jgi:hypothetical protein